MQDVWKIEGRRGLLFSKRWQNAEGATECRIGREPYLLYFALCGSPAQRAASPPIGGGGGGGRDIITTLLELCHTYSAPKEK